MKQRIRLSSVPTALLSILVLVSLAMLPRSATSGTVSFTGAELASNPDLFPTVPPIDNGDGSITLGAGGAFDKLLVLPLIPAGALSGSPPVTISVQISLTRLTDDWDPLIALGDGTSLVGAQLADNGGGQFFGDTLTDTGNAGTRTGHTFISSINDFPNTVGQELNVTVEFEAAIGATTVRVNEGSFPSAVVLDPTADLSFVFLRDNDGSEAYQLNALSITGPGIGTAVSIDIAGGTLQECSGFEGADVDLSVSTVLPPGQTIASVMWFLDTEALGSGESLSAAVPVGMHTIEAVVTTSADNTFTAVESIEIMDTMPPHIAVVFVDSDGEPIATAPSKGMNTVNVHYTATDICDPSPSVSALAGAPIGDGGSLRVQSSKDELWLKGDGLHVRVMASDASGNVTNAEALLPFAE